MEIFIKDIPEEGLEHSGTLTPAAFDLPTDDPIQSAGPSTYDATIYAFDDVIVLSGRLHGHFKLQCSTCLEYIDYEADFPAWSSELDREKGQLSFDLDELVREDFILNLPSYPRCDELVEGRVCPKAHLLEVDEAADGPQEDPPSNDVWNALDELS